MARLFLIVSLFLARAEEGARLLEGYNGRFLAGWEIELTSPQLERIVRYFSFDEAWRRFGHLYPVSRLDGYLSVPGAIEALPDELRREAEAVRDRRSVIRLDPEAEEASRDERLRQWWVSLPEARRRELVQPRFFPDDLKATLFSQHASAVTLAEDAPEGVRRLFSRLEWAIDQDTVEFRVREAMEDLAELERMRDLMGRLAQISRGFDDTTEVPRNGGASYHIHVSTKDGRNLGEFLRLLNLVLAVRLDAGGRTEVWGNGANAYRADVRARGVMREVAPNRFEIRAHSGEPARELAGILELLSLPRGQATERMRAELARTLTPEVIARIAARTESPEKLLMVARLLHTYGLGDRLPLDGAAVRQAYRNLAERRFGRGLGWAPVLLGDNDVAQRMRRDLAHLALGGRSPQALGELARQGDRKRLWTELAYVHWALGELPFEQWPDAWRQDSVTRLIAGLRQEPDGPAPVLDGLMTLLNRCADHYRNMPR